jgi:hypothetical protein
MATKVENPFERLRYTGKDVEASADWFREKIKDAGRAAFKPQNLVASEDLIRRRVRVGSLYLFLYDPKTKNQLPYYDTFPLVYPYRKTEQGFIGYNLHYLPPMLRFKVMGTLLNVQQYGTREEKRIAYSYGVLAANEADKYFSPCIRQYLSSHMRSNFVLIPPEDWLAAALLPTERFVKASSAKIWKETMDKI